MLLHYLVVGLATPSTPPMGPAPAAVLQALRPMVPPIAPGAAATLVLQRENDIDSLAWLTSPPSLALVSGGRPFICDPRPSRRSVNPLPQAAATTSRLAALDESHIACCTAKGVIAMPTSPPKAFAQAPAPLLGALGLGAARCAVPARGGRLLVASGDAVVLLRPEAPPCPLMRGELPAATVSLAISDDARTLHLCTATGVARAALDLDAATAAPAERVPELAFRGGAALAVDVDGSLFVATADGLLVSDEEGEVLLTMPTPSPASDLCFGGQQGSELFFSTGTQLWSVPTSTRGVRPPSAAFLRAIDKQTAAGEFRHAGW